MKKTAILAFAAFASLATPVAAGTEAPMTYEEEYARVEERAIINVPIAGIENELWFDYRLDVIKAQKKLNEKLREADSIKDERRSWERYANELQKRRIAYVEAMAKLGFRLAY
ncbi:hypothetical protein GCM10010923_06110 [Blastomonas marina]|uniref:Uncharacterized protein n=1 Tax=Blastomonas marina TaxID=1867408 RepID=A0ABQ1F6J6_9SPHN|nr:hypothetical protein [Blastomonas marina]GGA00306.1 hypothetical protein GCM10010923_06110 [Blastomonas marina]